jgi:hypothetical protein
LEYYDNILEELYNKLAYLYEALDSVKEYDLRIVYETQIIEIKCEIEQIENYYSNSI